MRDQKIPLPADWSPEKSLVEWALRCRPEWTDEHVTACTKIFSKWQNDKNCTRPSTHAWEQAWKAWVRRQLTQALVVKKKGGAGWWTSASGITAKGIEVGIYEQVGEEFPSFKQRVFKKCGAGPWNSG